MMLFRQGTIVKKGDNQRLTDHAVLLVGLAALVTVLVFSYSLKLWSDPAQWYCFGRDFPAQFGKAKLAYGFPLLLYLATKAVGPLPALLVNIPVLVLMALMLAAFTRSVFRGSYREVRILTPAAVILVLLVVDGKMLATLVSPYRDPLSFVFLLGSLLLFRRGMLQPDRRRYALLSGMALALAASTRETSVLAMPALLITAAFYKEIRFSILLRWFLWWGVGFVAASLPYLYQNTLVSGYPWIPAQAARTLDEEFSLTPGVRASFLDETLPRCIGYLLSHYSWIGVLLVGIGALLLWRRQRQALVLMICLFVIYLLFYGSYVYPVERYLMVLDLFVLPLMAGGVVWVAAAVILSVKRFHGSRAPVPAVLAFVLCLALAATSVRAVLRARSGHRFRLQDARRLQTLLQKYIPTEACLVSGRYFGEAASCLITNPVIISKFAAPAHNPWDTNLPRILAAKLHDHGTIYAALTSPSLKRMLAGEYDLRPLGTIDLHEVNYPLTEKLQPVVLAQLLRWSNTLVSIQLTNSCRGPACLEINLGRLSRVHRRKAVLTLNGHLLDPHPDDYLNYYRLDDTNRVLTVELQSDAPLPALVEAHLRPFPVTLHTSYQGLRELYGILSNTVPVGCSRRKYALLGADTFINLPALAHTNEFLLVCASLGSPARLSPRRPLITISRDHTLLCRREITRLPGTRSPWMEVSCALPRSRGNPDGKIHLRWSLTTSSGSTPEKTPLIAFLREISLLPADHSPEVLDIGSSSDKFWLVNGFYDRESSRRSRGRPLSWRWTAHNAEIRLITTTPGIPIRIRIDTLAKWRPEPSGASFRFNDRPVPAKPVGRDEKSPVVGYEIYVPPEMVTGRINRLAITCRTWSPAARGISPDTRRLGLPITTVHINEL